MKHDEYEKNMMEFVNRNCQVKEQGREQAVKAAQEKYQFECKCERFNAVICIIILAACFFTTSFAACALSYIGFNPTFATGVAAVAGLVFGLAINSMFNRIKK